MSKLPCNVERFTRPVRYVIYSPLGSHRVTRDPTTKLWRAGSKSAKTLTELAAKFE